MITPPVPSALRLETEDNYEHEGRAIGDDERNWLDLPADLTALILSRLGPITILGSAQMVCNTWLDLCKHQSMWKSIDMSDTGELHDDVVLQMMCRRAVDLSCGGLVDISVADFGTDELLIYIADRASELKHLRLLKCESITEKGIIEAVVKFPLLEDLEISDIIVTGNALRVVGSSCPRLKSLNYRRRLSRFLSEKEYDDDALAIAETMPELRHLHLFGNWLGEYGLQAIIDRCPRIESLDFRHCYCLYGLSKEARTLYKLYKQVCDFKGLKLRNDPTIKVYTADNLMNAWRYYGERYRYKRAYDYYTENYENYDVFLYR